MMSDSDLLSRLHEILRTSDLDTATAGSIRRQLQKELDVDLSDRKAFITEQIDIFLQNLPLGREGEVKSEDDKPNEEGENESENENENDDVEKEVEEESEEKGSEEKRSTKAEKEVKKKRGGFSKLCSLSPQLQEFVGVSVLARTEVVKRLWAYIREKDLQDPKNRRNIKCDETLRGLFRVNTINMFQMNKALCKHIWPLDADDEIEKPKTSSGDGNNSETECDDAEEEDVEKETKRRSKKRCGSSKVDKDVKKRGGGFAKLCSLSPQLQDFIGEPELARTEVVRKLWAYIQENHLQDPKNKRNIMCDESLRSLFDVDSIDMFQMNKALSKHIWPLNGADAPDNSLQKETRDKKGREEDLNEPKQKEKRLKKGSSGLLAPLPLSDALAKFFGEDLLSRADVVKRMWNYIKDNELQDPSDKRRIICDDKLKELFEVDSFIGFSVSKLLTPHFIKKEQ